MLIRTSDAGINLERCLRGAIATCLAVMAFEASAQQATYSYDQVGNISAVSITGGAAPTIEAQPQVGLFQANGYVSFSVVADGTGMSYQWLSNGVAIAGATGDTLSLANLPATASGSFSVVVTNILAAVTSAPVALWLDSRGVGMPDWWQMQYFGNLKQPADGDYDGDGVDNVDEYLEGTDPTNPRSYDPRLHIQASFGSVVASPDLPYYTMGQVVTLTAIPDPGQMFLGWGGSASGTNATISLAMNSNSTVIANFGLPLAVALDNANVTWTTGGDAPWFGQTEVSEDGLGAAQSGSIVGGQQSWLQAVTTNWTQPFQLAFWWNVSSQSPDALSFSIDGTAYTSIAGAAAGWQRVTVILPAGPHTLVWAYTKQSNDNPTGIPFADSGWVDQVMTLTGFAPSIIQQPAPASVILYAGRLVSFSASAIGEPAPSYQWQAGVAGTGAFTNVINGATIAGATTASLAVSNVTAADAGAYRLVASNTVGAATSTVATLSVLVPPTPGPYANAVFTNGPLAYWRFSEGHEQTNALDFVGDLAGTYGSAGLWGLDSPSGPIYGPIPPAFPGFEVTNTAVETTGNGGDPSWVTVPTPVLSTNTVTFLAWIYPTVLEADYAGLFMTRAATQAGIDFTTSGQLGYTWNGNSSNSWGFQSGLVPPLNEWSMVAVAIQPTMATLYLCTGGSVTNAINLVPHDVEAWGGPAAIGNDPCCGGGRVFKGTIDEVALFEKALSFDQIDTLYGVAVGKSLVVAPRFVVQPTSVERYAGLTATFQALATGSPLSYQWLNGNVILADGGNISGARTDTLTLSNLTAADTGDYSLVVTNSSGSVTSGVATLAVEPRSSAAYEAAILSANPLAYWRLNETNNPSSGTVVAYDYVGGLDGIYGTAALNGFDGVQGPEPPALPGFSTNNWALETRVNVPESYANVPLGNLGTNTVTFTAWVHPNGSQADWAGLLMSRSGSVPGGFGMGGALEKSAGMLAYTWNNNTTWTFASGLTIPLNQWSFVAVAIAPDQATLYLDYVDPTTGATNFLSAVNPIAHTPDGFGTNDWQIGSDICCGDGARTFNGSVDEVAVFERTLSGSEVNALFAAALGSTPLGPLMIAAQPTNQLVLPGATAQFSVTAAGSQPLFYQWLFDGTNLADNAHITGSQSNILTLTSVTMFNSGTYQVVVTNVYGSTNAFATLTVQAAPIITWTNPAPVPYGTALGSVQLDAAASVPGVGIYNPPAGTVLSAGTNVLSFVFSPTNATGHSSATTSVSLVVLRAPLTVMANNATRFYGAANPAFTDTITGLVNGDNITATNTCSATAASPAGTYAIIPSLIDPNNRAANYTVTLVNGTLTVFPATPIVTWTNPAPITYGTALTSNQLNATANVRGAFAYTPTNGTILFRGTNALSVIFIPTDPVDYSNVTDTVNLLVSCAPLTVTASNLTWVYGQCQSNPVFSGAITGIQNGDNITAIWSSAATCTSPPGTYSIAPTLASPSNLLSNYCVTLMDGTLTILAAPPPAIASVIPNTGPTNGGTVVSVLGTGFESGAAVNFGSIAATAVTFIGPTNLSATSPPATAGAVNIVVTNTDGQVGVLTNGFTYLPPGPADRPIALSGYNRDVVVPNTATGGDTRPYAQPFDSVDNLAFYETGLGDIGIWALGSGSEGLPTNRTFTSALDGVTVFQFEVYTGSNVLHLDANSMSGTLTLNTPAAYNSLSVLSASANGGGAGSVVIQFADNSTSSPIGFNAADWLGSGPGAALSHFGEIDLGDLGSFFTVDPAGNTPNLYQSTTNLAAAGLSSKPILSFIFTMPTGSGGPTDTGIFAVSGTPATNAVASPPVFFGVTATPGNIHFTWSAIPGQNYQIQYKTNLAQAAWSNLGGAITATNSTAAASDSIGPESHRFYRAVLMP